MWRNDNSYKAMMSAVISFVFTAVFTLYHGYLGLRYSSVWHSSICVFYLLLMLMRGSILLTEHRNQARPEIKRNLCRRWTFLITSALLLILDLALMLPIALMVVLAKPVTMRLTPAIAMAAYTTWKIVMASIHVGRQKRCPSSNILVSELRTINFIDALVSILTLQNTLIVVNQTGGNSNDMFQVSAGSSAIIYIVIVSISIRMFQKGLRQMLVHSSQQLKKALSDNWEGLFPL